MSYFNVSQQSGLGAVAARRPAAAPRYRRVVAPRAVRRPDGSMLFLVPKGGLGYTVNTAVYGMAEPTPVEDTASFVAYRTDLIKETNWGWTTPDQYRAAMIDLVSNRCSLYTDACAGIGSNMAQWTAYVDGTLMPPYVSWYNQALADFKAKNNGMNPDQAAIANKATDDLYNATAHAAAAAGASDAEAGAQAQLAVNDYRFGPSAPAVVQQLQPQQQQQTQIIPPTQVATTSNGGTGAGSSTGGGGATPVPPPILGSSIPAVSDFFNNTFDIAGFSVPVWALGAGVVGLLFLPSFLGRGR